MDKSQKIISCILLLISEIAYFYIICKLPVLGSGLFQSSFLAFASLFPKGYKNAIFVGMVRVIKLIYCLTSKLYRIIKYFIDK